ncbi:hypothetical protein RclHR1_07830013 [Rhizophagus clarus]|uniref:Uncharacterized protein n=1 Tax=Rhizophagus clarus TaxID=94130 RepID=A0A2Z6RYJ7_9GLOM|nr:hypothetical protein RclHR1_07830013 [Rhizophagus clarus]
MMGPKLKRQPVASTSSQTPKRKRKIITLSSSEEDNTILDMVQTRSAKKKAKESKMNSESSETGKSMDDDSESLSDVETLDDTDQVISDDSNGSRIATRSKRRVNRINYSDEKYFRSRLGNDPDDLKKKKRSSSGNNSEKKRFKFLKSINGKNDRSTNQDKKISKFNSSNKKSKYHQETDNDDDDDDDDNDDDNDDDSETDKFSGNNDSMEGSSDQVSEDDDSESDSSGDGSKSIIDPISVARANNSEFISAHLDWCKKCGGSANRNSNNDKGPLVLCEYCSNSFHSICYSRKTTNSKIICQQCNKIDSHVSRCMICHEESYSKENNNSNSKEDSKKSNKVSTSNLDSDDSQVFFRCLNCTQAAHESCLPFLNEEKTLKDKMISYRESWKCHLCLKWEDKVDKILTYRKAPTDKDKVSPVSPEIPESQDTPTPQSEDISSDSDNIEDYEFLVKFKDLSYIQVEWVPGPWLYGVTPNKYNVYIKSQPEQLSEEEVVQKDWTKIHRILDVQFKSEITLREQFTNGQKNLGRGVPVQAYVKWKGLNYFDATWEPIKNLDKRKFEKAYQVLKNSYAIKEADIFVDRIFDAHLVQPAYLKNKKFDNTLKDYQLDGVNWLLHNWCNEISCILADEMGLGKTIQIIVFLLILYKERGRHPFLIVAPKSTTAGWSREFKRWARELNVIEYHGDRESLKIVEDYEMFPDGASNLKCHVVITTPEAIQQHTKTFSKVPLWEVLVVDEAHSLKSGQDSLRFKILDMKFKVFHKVLLTGTPMMNCIDELFNLLKFLGHKEFENPKKLAEEYQGLPTVDQLPALHKLLKTYFLRRTKSQVNLGLPPMDDVIVRVPMTQIQKTIYKETLEKNADFLKHVSRANRSTGFSNILMSLRQIVSHPYIINREEIDPEDERTEEQEEERKKKLVETSGKLVLLRDMLIKLHETKHRVLIFSQFVSMLSILEEFLEDLGYKFVKLDGSTDNELRQHNINAFQAPDSDIFVFLLSTRAGGVGLNLMAADTVFIFEPDFNPHQDIQALSRVHRIGQYKPVKVFRFITQFSIEEKIVEKGKIKLAKNELVVEKMDNENLDVKEVDDIIRYGAEALFSEDENEKLVGTYTDEAIEKLLDRSQMKTTEQVTESKNLTGFAFARIWDTKNQEIVEEKIIADDDVGESVESRDFWSKLLAHVANTTSSTEAPIQGRGARKRNKVDYYEGDITTPKKKQGKKRSIDPDFVPVEKEDVISSESDSGDDDSDDPSALDISNSKPVITSRGGMLSKKRKEDGPNSKRQRQSIEDDIYIDNPPIMDAANSSEFQNIYQNVTGSSTSYGREIYGYPYYTAHGQWQYHYESYNYQFHQVQMPIIHPQPQQLSQQVALLRPIAPSNKTNPQQNIIAQQIYTHDHNLPKAVQSTQNKVPTNNNALMQPVNFPNTTTQQNISIRPITSMHSNVHNLTNIPTNSNMHDHNHISIPMQMPTTNPIQSKLPDLQSQAQQYQPHYHNERSKSNNSTSKNVVIKEVSAETLKRKINKVSTTKSNDHQPLLNFPEPIVIISDDETEPECHEVPQNGERKDTESKSISVTPTSESSSSTVNMKTLDSPKNKGKQVVQHRGQNSITPSKSTNNQNVREFIRLFDEIQNSKEDFGLRLIAITRLYHKLISLNYDIEGHITLLEENDQLDKRLLKEFRNGIK